MDASQLYEDAKRKRKAEQFSEAIKSIDVALKIEPENARYMHFKGLIFSDQRKEDLAINCFEKSIQLDPTYSDGYYSKGKSANKLKYFGLALQAFNEAISLDEDDYKSYIEKGNTLITLKKYTDAIVCFKKALEILADKQNLEGEKLAAFNRMGVSFSRIGDEKEAITCFDEALKINPKDVSVLIGKAVSLSKLGREHEALNCFETAMEQLHDDVYTDDKRKKRNILSVLNNKGRTLEKMGNYEKAQESYNAAIDFDKTDYRAYFNKANLLVNLEKFDEAVESFDNALENSPENTEILAQKGFALAMAHKYSEADQVIDSTLKIDSECPAALIVRGIIKARKDIYQHEILYQKKLLDGIITAVGNTEKNLGELSNNMEVDLKNVSYLIYIQFILGVLLIFAPFFGQENIYTLLISIPGGTALIITSVLIAPNKIQKNRIDYSQWLIAYYNWINSHFNISNHLLEEAQKRRLSNPEEPRPTNSDWDSHEKIFNYLNEISNKTINQMEIYCEFPLRDETFEKLTALNVNHNKEKTGSSINNKPPTTGEET